MKRFLTPGLLLSVVAVLFFPLSTYSADEKAKEALQALQEFIGDWKGSGGPDKAKPGPKDVIWSESISWGWRFKGDDVALTMTVKNGKQLKSGEMHISPIKSCIS